MSVSDGGTQSSAWGELAQEVEACTRCPLHRTRSRTVFYRGGPEPRLLFVGEAPGAEEDRQGVPFVGRSGRLLDRGVEALGVPSDAVGILNLLKCRPPRNVFTRESAAQCRPYLDRQIALLAPSLVVPLGAHALAALDRSAPRITEAAGKLRTGGPWPIFPLLHPAATFRSLRNLERWHADLGRLRSHLAARANP